MRMEAHLVSVGDSNLCAVACCLAAVEKKEKKNQASKLHLITHYKWVAEISAPHKLHCVT